MKSIKYIGFYIKDINNFVRVGSIAATNKMDYISCAINAAGYEVNIVSPAWFSDDKRGYSKQYTIRESESKTITFAPSFSAASRLMRGIRVIYTYIWLFFYLLRNTKRNEDVFVYHSLFLIRPVLWAKAIIKFNLILEANEIYCDVMQYSKRINKLEYKMFLSADKYIFSTELLAEKLNKRNQPYAINYGTYLVEKNKKCKFNDGKIHIVYAGIIDNHKGGGAAAVAAAMYLDNNYHIHIIGFGNERNKKILLDMIEKTSKMTECKVTYDGLLKGEEYIRFLQKCEIGLSTQSPDAAYNETSFPSKVLSYLANGLRVVSIRIKAIEQSEIGNMMYFYDNDTPKDIAAAIKNINFTIEYDSRKKIQELNSNFVIRISKLIC